MVSINHSELCISMNFYFHFVHRIVRLVSEFPLLKTWMNIWFLFYEEREGGKEKERRWVMPRGTWRLPTCSRSTSTQGPSIHPRFQFSAIFSNQDFPICQWWNFTKEEKWLAQSHLVAELRSQSSFFSTLCLFSCTPLPTLALRLSALLPHATKSGLGFCNIDLHI